LRAELGELRARVAERDRAIVVLTEENTVLREQNAMLAEKLVALVDRVAELDRRLGQTPRNSHQPPSSEGYDKPAPRSRRERTDRARGGQRGHEGRTLRQVETPDERVVHTPHGCRGCGRSLIGAPVVSTETRQVFAHDLRVPFTNNGSEQDVRPLKIRMKVAGCLRSTTGAEAFCRLRSYLSTARKQGQSSLIVLRTLRDGSPWMPATAG